MEDLIQNKAVMPSFEAITGAIEPPARAWWQDLNGFLQEQYQSKPKIIYSTCAGKPGWNIKYQKSGKALCTLYPEKNCFVALVVIPLDLVPLVQGAEIPFHPQILDQIRRGKPFNGTFWLMITVNEPAALESVKDLIALKSSMKRT